jgi:hypothetical protein
MVPLIRYFGCSGTYCFFSRCVPENMVRRCGTRQFVYTNAGFVYTFGDPLASLPVYRFPYTSALVSVQSISSVALTHTAVRLDCQKYTGDWAGCECFTIARRIRPAMPQPNGTLTDQQIADIGRTVASWPPLTPEQRDAVAAMFADPGESVAV